MKSYIKSIICQGVIALALSILTFAMFALNGNLTDFINYAFLGIGEFGTRNIKMEIANILAIIVVIALIICNVIIYKKIASKEQKHPSSMSCILVSSRRYGPGAGEMTQQVRIPTPLPKVLSSNPSDHMVAHNHL